MNNNDSQRIARFALAVGFVLLLAGVLLALFFIVGQPFGSLNDAFTGFGAILSAALAWAFYPQHRATNPRAAVVGLVAAIVGAVVVALGSVLVITRLTGYVLAGLYTTVGFALVGLWLLLLGASAQRAKWLPRAWALFGLVSGGLMLFGLFAMPGILTKTDSMDALPWYLALSQVSYLGTLLYIVWCFGVWRSLTRNALANDSP